MDNNNKPDMSDETPNEVIIYTDGGADPNPGYGGWAAVLQFGPHEKELTGNAANVTNNRMELQAALSALQALTRPCQVRFYTDSQYLQRGITEWMDGWAAQNWRKKGQLIPNADLWQKLRVETKRHEIDWHWVKGHAGNELNERVDQLATAARLDITPQDEINSSLPRLYVRGSCLGNPGPGGWGVVLEEGPLADSDTTQFSGSEPNTSNNRMELMAVYTGLGQLDENTAVQIITVSDYVYQGATQWINGWRKRNWKKRGGQPIANADLWQAIDNRLQQGQTIRWLNAKSLPTQPAGLEEARQLATTAAQEEKEN